jgi:hypothetical protein
MGRWSRPSSILLLSTLALEGTEAPAAASGGTRPGWLLRYADLALLALALPIFVLADWPLLGYAVIAAVWIVQHVMLAWADRASVAALADGNRNRAMGIIGGITLGRLWLVATAILLVGLLGEREDGLAAAVLALALVTVHLASLAITKLFMGEGS